MRLSRISIVLVIAAALGCAEKDPTKAGYWIDKLKVPAERAEALRELAKIGDKSALPSAIKYFEEEGEWQAEAATAIGALGDKSHVALLLKGLDVNANANDRIGRMKSARNQAIARVLAGWKSGEAVEPLTTLLKRTSDDHARETVVRALGEIGDPRVTDVLTDLAVDDKQPRIRRGAIAALGELRDAKAVPALVKLLYLDDSAYYEDARFALIRIGAAAAPAVVNTLERKNADVEAIKDGQGKALPEGSIESHAASVLGAMRAASAEAALVAALGNVYKRYQAARSDTALGGAVVELAYALGYLGTPTAAAALQPLTADQDADVRLAASEALTFVGDASAVPALAAAAKKGSHEARRVALVALTRLGGADQLAGFDALAADSPELAQAVASEKARLTAAAECKTDAACWRGKLGDADPRVRERAAYQLGWLGDKAAADALLKAAEDETAEVRFAAVLSLDRTGMADAAKLTAIQERWANRAEYRAVNAEIARVIATTKAAKAK